MSIKTVKPGDVLYSQSGDCTLLVVMVNDEGFRYINPMDPTFDDYGKIESYYEAYNELSEWTISLGSITNISATLMGKRS